MTCFVRNCKNVKRLLPPSSKISFFRFPQGELFHQWLQIIRRDDGNRSWSKSMYICSEHFTPDDISRRGNRQYLNKTAVPSIRDQAVEESVAQQNKVPGTSTDFVELQGQPGPSGIVNVRRCLFPPPSTRRKATYLENFKYLMKTRSESRSGISASPGTDSSKGGKDRSCGTGSDSSSTKRKRGKISSTSESIPTKRRKVRHDHPYGISPRTVKRKSDDLKEKYTSQSKKLYKARENIKNLKRRVNLLKDIVEDLKVNHSLSTGALDHLKQTFGDTPGRSTKTKHTSERTNKVLPTADCQLYLNVCSG